MQDYCKAQLQDSDGKFLGHNFVRCPAIGCRRPLHIRSVRDFVPHTLYNTLVKALADAEKQSNEHVYVAGLTLKYCPKCR